MLAASLKVPGEARAAPNQDGVGQRSTARSAMLFDSDSVQVLRIEFGIERRDL
jgi:hypothetical protein